MLLCKCSTEQVESFFDNPAKNFPAKSQHFLVKIQKKTKNKLFNKFFWYFFLCTLRLLFQHTWLIFLPKSEKTHWKSKRDDKSENYFNRFFSKFRWGHVKCTLATCRNCSPKFGYFRSETKNDQRITLLSKGALKRSAAPVGFSFEKFDKTSHQKFNTFAQRPKTLSKVSSFQRNVLKLFLWTLWMEFWQSCESFLSNCSNFSARYPKII